jgi:hypothetical protein
MTTPADFKILNVAPARIKAPGIATARGRVVATPDRLILMPRKDERVEYEPIAYEYDPRRRTYTALTADEVTVEFAAGSGCGCGSAYAWLRTPVDDVLA